MRVLFRLKRGWRVSALGTTATLIGLGVWSAARPMPATQAQPTPPLRHNAAPRHVQVAAVSQQAEDAPCSDAPCLDTPMNLPGGPNSLRGQAPIVVLARAGTVVQIRARTQNNIPGVGTVLAGGTWDALWGSIQSNGTYTAPSNIPLGGLDTVTYTDPSPFQKVLILTLRVLPNPDIPGSENPRVWNAPFGTLPLPTAVFPAGYYNPPQPVGDPPDFAPVLPPFAVGEKLALRGAGEALAPPAAYQDIANIGVTNIGGQQSYVLPGIAPGALMTSVLYALRSGLPSLQTARLTVVLSEESGGPPIGGGPGFGVDMINKPGRPRPRCQEGLQKPGTTSTSTIPKLLPPYTVGTFTVNTELAVTIKGKLKILDTEIQGTAGMEGQWTVTCFPIHYTKITQTPIYQCVNGWWIYQGKRVCTSFAVGGICKPTWGRYWTGDEPNGAPPPPDRWSPPVCYDTN